ncbi:hypothetical protein AMTRI_Chr07g29770 [Amborella trichopoda]
MVAETWIYKMGNQVTHNLKTALSLDPSKKNCSKHEKQIIGILSFEVSTIMSKLVHLYKSLRDQEILRVRNQVFKSLGVTLLVSEDESFLLDLMCGEKLEELNHIADSISRLGKKCSEPALVGFEHVYSDLLSNKIDVKDLSFLVKDMDSMVKKMERYIASTCNLFSELEVLNELEQGVKKLQQQQGGGFFRENQRAIEQKLMWQRQGVRHLRDVSLWNETYDKIVGMLARIVCTIYAKIRPVFGFNYTGFLCGNENSTIGSVHSYGSLASGFLLGNLDRRSGNIGVGSGDRSGPLIQGNGLHKRESFDGNRRSTSILQESVAREEFHDSQDEDFSFPCGSSPGRLFMECLSLSTSGSSSSKIDTLQIELQNRAANSGLANCHTNRAPSHFGAYNFPKLENSMDFCFSGELNLNHISFGKSGLLKGVKLGPKSRFLQAPSSTIGGSALALHYANVIIVIEKLLKYPHLVGEEARSDLYQMLPTSLRACLRKKLKSYSKNLVSAIYDAPLAHDWREAMDKILKWLSPLAHDMIRWQTERNFEQQQFVSRTNVLLLQTLYFADREKTEEAVSELLVGLNYICRYEHQQNALMDCTSSHDFDELMEWQLQY